MHSRLQEDYSLIVFSLSKVGLLQRLRATPMTFVSTAASQQVRAKPSQLWSYVDHRQPVRALLSSMTELCWRLERELFSRQCFCSFHLNACGLELGFSEDISLTLLFSGRPRSYHDFVKLVLLRWELSTGISTGWIIAFLNLPRDQRFTKISLSSLGSWKHFLFYKLNIKQICFGDKCRSGSIIMSNFVGN